MEWTSAVQETETDFLLIGGGIMSSTLGVLLSELEPNADIVLTEALPDFATESSSVWNNAGTGHAALCELNYTPESKQGNISTEKAFSVAESFMLSRQFWASLVEKGELPDPSSFINSVPHMSFVYSEDHVRYLENRHRLLAPNPLFESMEFSRELSRIGDWAPLLARGRDRGPVAATRSSSGTDIDFGALTRQQIVLLRDRGVKIHTGSKVTRLTRDHAGAWLATISSGDHQRVLRSKFVFVGAGGEALPLLQKARIKEISGYGAFPVSGMWLRTDKQSIVNQHNAKVYGQAAVGAPPMSVPHLDTRYEHGRRSLLFGPYAGFKPNFLKSGSWTDLPKSIRLNNIYPIGRAGLSNVGLVTYLVGELFKNKDKKLAYLREFFPEAEGDDWRVVHAGQRVQIMKPDAKKGGELVFGTELVSSADGSIAGLLGASPGASTAVGIMIDLLERCFPDDIKRWKPRIQELIPSLGTRLNDEPQLLREIHAETSRVLKLELS